MAYYTRCDYPEGKILALRREGYSYAKQAKNNLALGCFERSFELLEQMRRQTGLEELKMHFLEDRLEYYEDVAGFMLRSAFCENAFRTAERMRARLFLDRLAEGQVDLEKGVDPELKARRDSLETRRHALRKRQQEETALSPSDEDRARRKEEFTRELGRIDSELAELEATIRLKNPLYASVQYPDPPTVAEIQANVLSGEEVLLEYFLGKPDAWCFVLTRNAFRVVKLPLGTEEIGRTVRRLLAWVVDLPVETGEPVTGGKTKIPTPVRADAGRLYEALIAPLGRDVRGKTLIIVPDGILSRLPFEVLVTGTKAKPAYLVERQAVRYAPSAAVLHFFRTRYRREGASDRFIGLGDPVYDYEKFRAGEPESRINLPWETLSVSMATRNTEGPGTELDRLPGTGDEIRTVEKLFQEARRDGKAYLRDQAREERIRSDDSASCGYIHLAAHGILADDYQAIALSRIPGSTEDGLLSLGEIMNLKWDARLVVLSACETGLGPLRRGEGVTGLARAVMYAGSPAAVVSLWNVPDTGTRELMTRFYRKMLRGGLPPAEALQQAKREMVKSPGWNSPFCWAAFVLYGE